MTSRRAGRACGWAACALGIAVAFTPACGKKGPPLAPLPRVPAAAGQFSARRLGSTVYLQLVVPTKNQDNSTPADVTRVELYGYTGTPASDDDLVKYGTLVATVPVRKPPQEDEDRQRGSKPAAAPRKPEQVEPGFDQGATVTVTETLTQALMQPVVVVPKRSRAKVAAPVSGPVILPAPSFDDVPARVYAAVAVNHKGHRGVFSPHAAVPLVDLPPPPTGVTLAYTETQITLEWPPPPGVPTALEQQTDAPYVPSRPIAPSAAPGWFYDVFDVPVATPSGHGAGQSAPPVPMPRVEPPVPLNAQPLAAATFIDPRPMEFGVERCYAVRTINVFGRIQQQSEPSPTACITPRDTFPPAAPKGLIAVAGDGVISLNWAPNSEPDLGGYIVLRGEAPGATLQPLTRDPIHDTSYQDKTAQPGVRYVYAVVAVDKATPPNVSAQSNRIEETAR